jgi:hypothetical protein
VEALHRWRCRHRAGSAQGSHNCVLQRVVQSGSQHAQCPGPPVVRWLGPRPPLRAAPSDAACWLV